MEEVCRILEECCRSLGGNFMVWHTTMRLVTRGKQWRVNPLVILSLIFLTLTSGSGSFSVSFRMVAKVLYGAASHSVYHLSHVPSCRRSL